MDGMGTEIMALMSRSRFLKFLKNMAGLAGLSLFSLFRCDNGKLNRSPLGPSDGTSFRLRVSVVPAAVSVLTSGTQTFSASGGSGTSGSYSWSVSNAALGSIDPSTGLFTAGATAGTLTVTATDAVGNTGTSSVTVTTAIISISPLNLTIVRGGTQTFTATGGAGTYTWVVSDPALGTIVSTTGAFTARNTAGTMTVTAIDTTGVTGTATVVIVGSTLTVVPVSYTAYPGATQTIVATGGTGVYSWTVDNTAIGRINSSTGDFTAGATAGTVTITATDTANNTGTTTITVLATTLAISPVALTIVRGGSQTYTATGGTGVYAWAVSDSSMGRMISTTGVFTSGPNTGTLGVTATDSAGSVGSGTITVIPAAITLNPVDLTIAQGGSTTFTATGGTGVYTWTLSDTALGRIISTTGVFTAWYAAGTLTVTATDTAGNTGTTNVTIVPTGLTIAPISLILNQGDTYTFTTTGGTDPYFYSSSNTAVGAIDLHTGTITAGTTAGTTTVTVTDSAGNTGTALVTVL